MQESQNNSKESSSADGENLPKIIIRPDMKSAKKVSKNTARMEKKKVKLIEKKHSKTDEKKQRYQRLKWEGVEKKHLFNSIYHIISNKMLDNIK